jgi:hypothetical protein
MWYNRLKWKKDILLCNAIKIAEIFLLMGKRFGFIRESSQSDSGYPTTLPFESSRLLNRQIKSGFAIMLSNMIPMALERFDKRLRAQEKATWAVSLLTLLLLSSCIGHIQVAIDASIFAKVSVDGADQSKTRQCGRDICCRLEQEFLEHTWVLVEGIFKSISNNSPFKVGPQQIDDFGMNEAEINLVSDIRQILILYGSPGLRWAELNWHVLGENIANRADRTCYDNWSHMTSEYKKFKLQNGDRLVSKILERLSTWLWI